MVGDQPPAEEVFRQSVIISKNSYMSQLKGGDLIDISRQVLAKKFLKGDLRKSKQ